MRVVAPLFGVAPDRWAMVTGSPVDVRDLSSDWLSTALFHLTSRAARLGAEPEQHRTRVPR